jgi:hypothetical protein
MDYTRATIEGLPGYNALEQIFYIIKLIKSIKGLTYQFDGQTYQAMALHQANKQFYGLHQGRDMTNAQFLERFHTSVYIVEQYGGGWELTHQPFRKN